MIQISKQCVLSVHDDTLIDHNTQVDIPLCLAWKLNVAAAAAASAHLGSGAAGLDRLAVVVGATQAAEPVALTSFTVVVVPVAGRRRGPLPLLLVAAACGSAG